MKKQLFMGGLVIGSLLALAPNVQAGFIKVTIDDFTLAPEPPDDPLIINNPLLITGGMILGDQLNPISPKMNTTTGPETSIIGGERELTFERISPPDPFNFGIGSAGINPLAAELSISNPPNYNSLTSVLWDGTDANPLDADLSEQDFFTVAILGTDEVPFNLSLTVVDNENNTSTVTRPGRDIKGNVNIFFEEFEGVDFTTGSIQSIELIIQGVNNDGFDATISFLTAEPIPEGSAVLGLSVFGGLGILSQKRRSK